ncbi:MAG: hypothetical protein JXA50_01590 [Deltaproteobacteria bacterium]|nr:hypothetical protein [Deltaproteobacteria bacterium]
MKHKRANKQRKKWRKIKQAELAVLYTRIKGKHKISISDSLFKETEGMPWHARRARISAITGRPFSEVSAMLES